MNTSGINPIEYNVLIQLDEVDEKTAGGVIMPQAITEKESFAQVRGILSALSPMAFKFDDWPADTPAPKAGDKVMIAKHAGAQAEGADGKTYRIVKDKDVLAVIDD